ncbi:TniB family NTP-binding protein [Roseomonas xinghualingensis]|uniref:TniB family NTP-binding protein n=1 Tax=Roseomonas xinghualingensis TaxID=2986475 RepID=UPI0021F1C683|nr:TniB family NTP-binding protein [Roseomonas sp. SXEYE001]MCV4209834.1 TniB family NTP-binding protein [Roseomonas sp. SXEYE001]
MTKYEHLDPQHRALADLPNDERIQWIRAERWISHPAAELALAAMEDLLTYPQRNRMPCLLVHGRTGMGKTMILRKFSRDHPKVIDPRLGLTQMPVVLMQLPPEPAEVPFYEELLGALGLPLVGEVSRIRARRMARDALRIIGARVLVIDEIHALLVGGDRQQRVFLNVIRLLANELEMPLVCAGTPEARRALLTDGGLADRFESVELPRWTSNLAFRRLLASYAAILPLRRPSELDQDRVRTAILKLTEGITVRIVRLLERLAVEAIRGGAERITLEGFEALPARAPLLSMEQRRRIDAVL